MSHPIISNGNAIQVDPLNHSHHQQKQRLQNDDIVVQIRQQPVVAPPVSGEGPPQPELQTPLDQLERPRTSYIKFGVPLYEAAIKGDWNAAKAVLDEKPNLIRVAINGNDDTLLHIAASAKNTKSVKQFVENLVDRMEIQDMELQNMAAETALCVAAKGGNTDAAIAMLNKNSGLIDIPNHKDVVPLYLAALHAKPDMVKYLYGLSNKMTSGKYSWTNENRGWVLQECVEAEIFDVALQIIADHPELYDEKVLMSNVLLILARKTDAIEGTKPNFAIKFINSTLAKFDVNLRFGVKVTVSCMRFLKKNWNVIAQMSKDDIDEILRGPPGTVRNKNKEKECAALPLLSKLLEKTSSMPPGTEIENENKNQVKCYPSRVLFVATKMGNIRFIIELIRFCPDLIWDVDDKGKTIFHLAIKYRQKKIYGLLYEIGAMKEVITTIVDRKENNMLHMIAKSAKQNQFQNVSGAALHMRSELLWFKEVEQIIPPQYRQKKNKDGETPKDLFAKKHAALVSKGEGWMKNYMLVATLIATVVFAAAFTLPGGYNQDNGIPYFRKQPSLIIFAISDAVSLICSSTSVLIFLSILTSNYAELDFLESLPKKLMLGVGTLFLSIVTMMVAFSASFFVLYDRKLKWVPITITSLAGMPIVLFAILQFQLLADVFHSANIFQSKSSFKPNKDLLYT